MHNSKEFIAQQGNCKLLHGVSSPSWGEVQTAGDISGFSPSDCVPVFTQPFVCFCTVRNLCYPISRLFVKIVY